MKECRFLGMNPARNDKSWSVLRYTTAASYHRTAVLPLRFLRGLESIHLEDHLQRELCRTWAANRVQCALPVEAVPSRFVVDPGQILPKPGCAVPGACPNCDFSDGGQGSRWRKDNCLRGGSQCALRSEESWKSDVHQSRQAIPKRDLHGVDLGERPPEVWRS
jgi:hypothetical protein